MVTHYRATENNATGAFMQIHEAVAMMLKPSLGRAKLKLDAFATRMGLSPVTLYQYAEGRRDLPAKLIPPLTHATRDLLLVEELAVACGGTFVPLPNGESLETHSMRRVIKEFAQLVDAACDAMEDGKVTPREADRVQREGMQAIQAIQRLLSEVRAQAPLNGKRRTTRAATLAAAED